MTYIENVLVCMAAPLLVALLLLRRKQRPLLLFCLAGMGMCLLAAYLNTFFAQLYAADALNAAAQIAPVVEEIMKLLPLLFYLAVLSRTRSASASPPSWWPRASPPSRTSAT